MRVGLSDPPDKSRPPLSPTTSPSGGLPWIGRWILLAFALPALVGAAPDRDWIDEMLDRIIPRERVGIPHCESMVSAQHRLASKRDTVRQILSEGISWRERCRRTQDSTASKSCLDSLTPLREMLREQRSAERTIADTVQRLAGRCSPAAFEAWREWRQLQNAPDTVRTDSVMVGLPFDRLVEMEFGAVWEQERKERGRVGKGGKQTRLPSTEAFRDRLRQYMGRRGAQNPSAKSYFLLAVLDHREGNNDQALFRLRRIPARDTSTAWKAPVALLYGQILAPTSPDSAEPLLATALADPQLAAPARFLLARLEENRGRPMQALEHISAYLDLPTAPGPGSREAAIQLTARSLVAMASPVHRIKEILETHLPSTARDTIALAVARQLLAVNSTKPCIELLSSFQVTFPGTRLGEDARFFLSQIRRNRPAGIAR